MALRILVAGSPPEALPSLARSLQELLSEAIVQPAPAPASSLDRAPAESFDAAICRADHPDQLDIVADLQRMQGDLPILLVSQDETPDFRAQALSAGVDSFIPFSRGIEAIEKHLRLLLEMRNAKKLLKDQIVRSEDLISEVIGLMQTNRGLRDAAGRLIQNPGLSRFLPLIIESDSHQAFLMVKALQKADIYCPIPILRTADEAVAYLSGQAPYSNRDRYPMPTAVVLDPVQDETASLKLLRWIRSHERLLHLPVLIVTGQDRVDDHRETFGFLANSYLIKEQELGHIEKLFRLADQYWSNFNITPDPR
jgi:DNA-binding response OmpR family regulator